MKKYYDLSRVHPGVFVVIATLLGILWLGEMRFHAQDKAYYRYQLVILAEQYAILAHNAIARDVTQEKIEEQLDELVDEHDDMPELKMFALKAQSKFDSLVGGQ